jgi:hypothetical protein
MSISRWLTLLLLLPLVSLRAQKVAPSGKTGLRKVDERRAVTSTPSLRVMGGFASLRIIGWDKDSVVITGVIPEDARFEGNFGGPNTGAVNGMKMYLELPDGPSAPAKIEMRIPSRARLWIKAGSSDVDVSGVAGGLDLNVIGGTVHVLGSPRELNVEAMDANVRVEGSPSWLRAKTATGDITLLGGSADLALTSVSGTIGVSDGAVERARIETVTGPVQFGAEVAHGGSLDVSTHSGDITLRWPRNSGAEMDIATLTGTIGNGLTKRPAVPGREGRGQEIGLTIAGGGARVYVRSFKGHIELASR